MQTTDDKEATRSRSGQTPRFSEERYLTPIEVARALGYRDDEAVRAAIREGRLRALQPSSRRTLVTESDAEAWLRSCAVDGGTASAALRPSTSPRAAAQSPRVVRKRELPVLGGAVVRP